MISLSLEDVRLRKLTCRFLSAKHLHSPDEQLHSLAGSFGYVAPEVLNKVGHGKAVDIWSTG
jgi:serine/threonine protein kinase